MYNLELCWSQYWNRELGIDFARVRIGIGINKVKDRPINNK